MYVVAGAGVTLGGVRAEGLLQGSADPSRSEQGVRAHWDEQPEPLRPCALFHKQSPGQL